MINKIDLVNISKIKKHKHILKDITLTFNGGEIVGIVGKNGAGKSSLFKVITGLWDISMGNIKVNNETIENKEICKLYNVSSFIEYPNTYENLKVKDNFKVLLSLYEINDLSWFNFLYKEFNISEFENKKLKKCSSGMRQKVGIVMSLLNDGDIVILDEPTNALDIDSVNSVYKILDILKSKNKIIIISSHIIDELEAIIDRAIILVDGLVKENYIKSITQSNYKIVLKNKDAKNKLLKYLSSYKISEIDDTCVEIEIKDLNVFMKECYESSIEIESINQDDKILKSLIRK